MQSEKEIKLLRNLCRILALPCVLATPNSEVNYLLDNNVTNESDDVWVYTIRELPKTGLKAVFNTLAWRKYTSKTNNFNNKKLLKDLAVKVDKTNLNQLDQIDGCSIGNLPSRNSAHCFQTT